MTFLLSLGFSLVCIRPVPVPGKDFGRTAIDHPVMMSYVLLKSRCWVDV